jgi:hypothetical protein
MVISADRDRVTSVCKACFARFEVIPYRRPAKTRDEMDS